MGEINLWPWIALGAYCFGVTSGIAWAAAWRPSIIAVRVTLQHDHDDA